MKKILLLIGLFPVALSAQRSDSTSNTDDSTGTNKSFIQVNSIGLYAGGDTYRDGFEDRSIFQQAVPSSALAYSDLTGYSNTSGYAIYYTNAGNASEGISLNLHLRCQKKFGELRAGLTHTNVNIASQYYSRSSSTITDTTTLPGGDIIYTDSVNQSYYRYNWNSDLITVHLGWVVHTSPRRLTNLYTGIGFSAGMGFNGIYNAEYQNYSQKYYESQSTGGYMGTAGDMEEIAHIQEAFKAPSFTFWSVYVPVGINIRLSRRQNFWGHSAFYFEYQGAVQFVSPAGVNSKIRTASTFAGGLRWYIRAPKSLREEGHHRHDHPRHMPDRQQNNKVD